MVQGNEKKGFRFNMGSFTTERNFEFNLSFGNFRDEDDFFDVTLAADAANGSIEALRAHKLILSASSPVLRSLLKEQSRLSGSSQGRFTYYVRRGWRDGLVPNADMFIT